MISRFLRSAGLVLLVGSTAFGGSVTEAANIGANLNIRPPSPNFPQSVYSGTGRDFSRGYGTSTPPPVSYNGPRSRVHEFDPNTQFDGMTGNTTNGKPPK